MIRPALLSDAEAITRIYNHYIENTIITFEEQAISADDMRQRIEDVTASLPWFVLLSSNQVIGYSYASRWKSRCAFRYSVESTVYLDLHQFGKGFGRQLYDRLLTELRARSIHSVVAGIALPNDASIALHEKCGFVKVAHFKEVGWKFNRWIDVGYWEIIL